MFTPSGSGRRFLLYLNCFWSVYATPGFEMLKKVAPMVPQDVLLISARVSGWFPPNDTALGRFLQGEVREGRMVDSFTKYRATMLYIEDGKIVVMRLNIASMPEDCLRKEAKVETQIGGSISDIFHGGILTHWIY